MATDNWWWAGAAALVVFGLAGVVKGVVGLGLPTLSMALLALFMPAGQAAAWLLLPSLVTNVVQMRPVSEIRPVWQRLWPMQLGIVIGTWGGMLLWGAVGSAPQAKLGLGLALVVYALWGLWGRNVQLPAAHQPWLGAVCGLLTGAITAVTGVFVVPAVAFLQALNFSRSQLMQAMGLCFTVSTLALGTGMALQAFGWMGGGAGDLGVHRGSGSDTSGDISALAAWGMTLLISAVMLLPALAGMAWGERLRERLSPAVFKRVLMFSLLALGIYMCVSG